VNPVQSTLRKSPPLENLTQWGAPAILEDDTGYPPADRINQEIDKYNDLIRMAQIEENLVDEQAYTACRDSMRAARNRVLSEHKQEVANWTKPINDPHWNPDYMG
jgi:hypothetical protein